MLRYLKQKTCPEEENLPNVEEIKHFSEKLKLNTQLSLNFRENEIFYKSNEKIKNEEFLKIREYFIDWIIQTSKVLNFTNQTLFDTINIFDLFVQGNSSIHSNELYSIGKASFLIAVKFNETHYYLKNLINSMTGVISKRELLQKELLILKFLKFRLPREKFHSKIHNLFEVFIKIKKRKENKEILELSTNILNFSSKVYVEILKNYVFKNKYHDKDLLLSVFIYSIAKYQQQNYFSWHYDMIKMCFKMGGSTHIVEEIINLKIDV